MKLAQHQTKKKKDAKKAKKQTVQQVKQSEAKTTRSGIRLQPKGNDPKGTPLGFKDLSQDTHLVQQSQTPTKKKSLFEPNQES